MRNWTLVRARSLFVPFLLLTTFAATAGAQQTDVTQTPNFVNAGIRKSFGDEAGPGRGDDFTPGTSLYLIRRDPFRSISRGRQLFQRKFTQGQGLGPRTSDGEGDIGADGSIGAGLADSCAACHGRPFGSAGFGGNVFTRPESRDAPHLFGLGLIEMLGDEITQDLRAIRSQAVAQASAQGNSVTLPLASKGIGYGSITAFPDGSVDASLVTGVDADLRVKPFFAQGKTFAMRDFIVGALNAEMGMEAFDPDLLAASQGQDVVTPAGLMLSGTLDAIPAPPAVSPTDDPDGDGVADEVPVSIVDHLEFYLLNYFRPATGEQTVATQNGFQTFRSIGCAACHVPNLRIDRDRRVADVRTTYDSLNSNGVYNQMFATATPLHGAIDDGSGLPVFQPPALQPFLVQGVYADFRRHDLGQAFHERNFDGTITTQFMTEPLWGVGATSPYGHDGRSATLADVILRHGGEAQAAHDAFVGLAPRKREELIDFLRSLQLFAPPDTASNLEPANKGDANFPLAGHGSINLSVLFVDPSDKE